MKTYYVNKTQHCNISLCDGIWHSAEKMNIDYSWENKDFPKTYAYMIYSSEGLCVKFVTEEYPITVCNKGNNEPVNRDSCVELFINPDVSENGKYLNFEINAEGYLHLQIGDERKRYDISDSEFNAFGIETKCFQYGWMAKFFIPFAFLKRYFNQITDEMRVNLFKCGDMTDNPHYLSWAPVYTKKPEFHRSEFFGTIKLKKED